MTSRVSICTALLAAPLFAGLLAGAAAADQHASTKICNPVQQGDGTAVIQSTGRAVTHAGSKACPEVAVAEPPEPARVAITLDSDVTFEFDKAELKPEAESRLQVIGDQLRDHPATELMVIGHTDNIGNADYNQGLSERRAKAVAEFLVKAGVPAGELKQVKGMGDTQPIASNDTDEGRAQNRRVEIRTP